MRLTVAEKTKRLRKIISSLEKRYGRGNFPERNSYLEQLVFYYVFYHANLSGARKVLKSFRDNYVDWNEVRVSSLGEIGATLQNHSITPEVAVPIKEVLNGIFSTQNRMSLDFLACT
jgi:endonuclease-3